MPTTLWTMDFSAGSDSEKAAKASRFYQTPALLAGTPAPLTIGTIGGVTALVCGWGVPASGTVPYLTYALMNAETPANGATANCYDADPTKHGYYLRSGGAWVRQSRVLDQPWRDPNHVGFAGYWLALWIQSWATNADDTAALDDWMAAPFNGWPYVTDLRGLELHARVRAYRLKKPRDGKIVPHFQTRALTHGDPGGGRRAYVNAFQSADIYSDALRFGRGGAFAPDVTDGVNDGGWVDLKIRFSTLDSYWTQLGAASGRDGLPGGSASPYVYVVEPPSDFLHNPAGLAFNSYIVSAHPVTDEANMTGLPSDDAFDGQMFVQWFKLVDPA